LLASELGEHVEFKVPDGGMSVWTKFLRADMVQVSKKAYAKGLIIRDGTAYDTPARRYNSVRMGFASLDLNEQEQAIGILKKAIY